VFKLRKGKWLEQNPERYFEDYLIRYWSSVHSISQISLCGVPDEEEQDISIRLQRHTLLTIENVDLQVSSTQFNSDCVSYPSELCTTQDLSFRGKSFNQSLLFSTLFHSVLPFNFFYLHHHLSSTQCLKILRFLQEKHLWSTDSFEMKWLDFHQVELVVGQIVHCPSNWSRI
jgi:hypothetical protein